MNWKALLASIFLVGVLAACNNNDDDNAAEDTEKAAENTETADEQNKENEEAAENKNADVVTTASIVNNADALKKAAGANGSWLFAILNDITMSDALVVTGEFHDKGDKANPIYRKFAPYAQDENRNVTARYTLTVPKMTVQSENFKIQGGTIKGDVYVEANGFTLTDDATIDGNLYFKSADLQKTANLEGKVSGEKAVK